MFCPACGQKTAVKQPSENSDSDGLIVAECFGRDTETVACVETYECSCSCQFWIEDKVYA